MANLPSPKLELGRKKTIARIFEDVCLGLTIVFIYGILWLFIVALGYRIFLWVF